MLDMTESIAPKSDQANADDLMAGPRTVLITEVRRGSADQPIEVVTDQFDGRPWRPSKTDRRVLVAAWGVDGSTYVGKRITLYRDPTVKWAGEAVGGIRIQAMSHIDKPLKLAMTVTRGKKAPYVVQPLPDAPTTQPDADGATQAQVRELVALLGTIGLSEKEAALEFLTDKTGRQIGSTKELTRAEAAAVIESLNQPATVPGEPTLDEGGWPATAEIPAS